MAKEFEYKIDKKVITLSINSKYANMVQIVAWNGYEPKFDIRRWRIDEEGNLNPAKGISLNPEEMQKLKDALNQIDDFEEYLG